MDKPYVLIIDEHEDSRIIVRTIAQYGGFDVVEARHGREGLEHAARRRPDLIVLDMELRLLPAHELLSLLRQDVRLKQVPIIGMSSNRDMSDAASQGIHAIVYKPIAIAALLAELKRLATPLEA